MNPSEVVNKFTFVPILLLFPLIINAKLQLENFAAYTVLFCAFLTTLMNAAGWFICKKYGMRKNLYLAFSAIAIAIPTSISIYFCIVISTKLFGVGAAYVVFMSLILLLIASITVIKYKFLGSSAAKLIPLSAAFGAVFPAKLASRGDSGELLFIMSIDFIFAYTCLLLIFGMLEAIKRRNNEFHEY